MFSHRLGPDFITMKPKMLGLSPLRKVAQPKSRKTCANRTLPKLCLDICKKGMLKKKVKTVKTHYSLLSTSLTQEDPSRNNWKIVEWYVKYQIKTKVTMRGSRNFRQGCSRSIWHIKSYDNVFLVLNLFYRRPTVTFIENYHFPRFQRGSIIFRRVQLFTGGGGQLLIP